MPPLFTKLKVCITIGQKVKHECFIWPIRNTKSERNTNVTLEQQKKQVCKMLTQQLGDKKNLKLNITERKNQT